MRIVHVIIVIFCCVLNASAAEPPKLTFLPENTYKYFQIKVENIDGNYVDVDVLRPLKEFKVGEKYCLWGSDNWDDDCQDAAMKYAYGARWPEFKQVALEFLKFTEQKGVVEIAKLPGFKKGRTYIIYSGPGEEIGRILVDATDIEYFAKKARLWRNKTDGIKYEEFLIDDCNFGDSVGYCLFFSKNLAINFDIELEDGKEMYYEEGKSNPSQKYHYLPEINTLYLFGN